MPWCSCHELWQACRRCSQREACEVCGQGYTLPAGYTASVRQLVSSGKLIVPSNPLQQLLDRVQGSLEPMWVLLSCWLDWCAQQAAAGEQLGRDWASSLQEVAAELATCPRPSNRRTAADWATEACKYNLALEAELSRLMSKA